MIHQQLLEKAMSIIAHEPQELQDVVAAKLSEYVLRGTGPVEHLDVIAGLMAHAFKEGLKHPVPVIYSGDTPLQRARSAMGDREVDVQMDAYGHISFRHRSTEFEMGCATAALEDDERAGELLTLLVAKYDERAHLEPARVLVAH